MDEKSQEKKSQEKSHRKKSHIVSFPIQMDLHPATTATFFFYYTTPN
jgi:hypothetical protein